MLANFIHLRYRNGVVARLCKQLGICGYAVPAPGDIEIKRPATAAPRAPAAMKKRSRKRKSPSVTGGKVCDNKLKKKRCLAAGEVIFSEPIDKYCLACKQGYRGKGVYSKKRAKLYDELAHVL